jgi:RNA polymerase sigma-70 factor (ECF subfamily)
MNGAWGFGQYRPGDDDVLRPFALVAVQLGGGGISAIVTFLGTEHRFGEFGLPDSVGARERAPR